jgi:CRISPR-associated protein Csd1
MHEMDKLHDEIVSSFRPEDFTSDSPLSGEFLLGYHCQRDALKPAPKAADPSGSAKDAQPV